MRYAFKYGEHMFTEEKCQNCGSKDKLAERLIVPEKAGGTKENSNIAILCRCCEMAMDSVLKSNTEDQRRAINFWVGKALHTHLNAHLSAKQGFTSMGSLVRYLIESYTANPERFSDLDQYQTVGSDTKINVWVDRNKYEEFKKITDEKNITVTDTIKSLISLYAAETENILEPRQILI